MHRRTVVEGFDEEAGCFPGCAPVIWNPHIREMGSWSEGERTTVAILLYCTLVKLRAQSRGQVDRRTEVSALLLDNPIGPCSKPEFLQMQRWIAGQLGIQLVYATGVNDPQALSVFPNRIRLAKNRIVPTTG